MTLPRTSKTLGPLSHARQFTFSGPFDSPTADGSVGSRMGPGIAALEGQAIEKRRSRAEKKGVVSTGSDVGFVVYRTVGISSRIELVERARAQDVTACVSSLRWGRAEVHPSTREQAQPRDPRYCADARKFEGSSRSIVSPQVST